MAAAGCLVGLVGCSSSVPTPDGVAPGETGTKGGTTTVVVGPEMPETPTMPGVAIESRYTQSFKQAAITDDIPADVLLPVDTTLAGKSTYKLRVEVETEWDKVELANRTTGEPIAYVATMHTSQGKFDITLNPKLAPNHVRNFIVLAKLGYYDGLRFDRIIHQVALDAQNMPTSQLDLLKAGCPLGIGEEGRGHIGYFMRPEFNEGVSHEAGTVGFWHENTAESAGTRIYITLGTAPVLDHNYSVIGKITAGLDVAKKISGSATQGETYPEIELPREPIVIDKVTISRP